MSTKAVDEIIVPTVARGEVATGPWERQSHPRGHFDSAVQEMRPAQLHRRGKRAEHPQRPDTERTAEGDLAYAVRDDPDAAAAIPVRLDHVVTRPIHGDTAKTNGAARPD